MDLSKKDKMIVDNHPEPAGEEQPQPSTSEFLQADGSVPSKSFIEGKAVQGKKRKSSGEKSNSSGKMVKDEPIISTSKCLDGPSAGQSSPSVATTTKRTAEILSKYRREIHTYLDLNHFQPNGNERFVLLNDELSGVIILTCDDNLKYLMSSDKIYFATFPDILLPKGVKELLIIHTLNEFSYVPLIYILLPDKYIRTYYKAFKAIKDRLWLLNKKYKLKAVETDFDENIRRGIITVWNVEIHCCVSHLTELWYSFIQGFRLNETVNEMVRGLYIKLFFGLPYLEKNQVSAFYEKYINANLPEIGDPHFYNEYIFKNFLKVDALYPIKQWAGKDFKINSICELYKLNPPFNGQCPHFLNFLRKIELMQFDVLATIPNNQYPNLKLDAATSQDDIYKAQRVKDNLMNGNVDELQFINVMCNLVLKKLM